MTLNKVRLRLNTRARLIVVGVLACLFASGSSMTAAAQRLDSQRIARQAVEDALIGRFGLESRPNVRRASMIRYSDSEDRASGTVSYRSTSNYAPREATWECIVNRSTGQVRDLRITGGEIPDERSTGGYPGYGRQTISCASDDGRRHDCRANTVGGVRLLNQQSEAACTFGRTWGYDSRGIWVNRGCRAEFEVGTGYFGGYGGASDTRVVTCSSDDMRRHSCNANTRAGVRLLNQESNAACVYGRTWGYNRNSIWVDRGCRAEFEIGR